MNTNKRLPPTMTIPEAGRRYFKLGRNSSYEAAKQGEIPWIPMRNRKLVPTALLHKQLGLPIDDIETSTCDEAA